jgi:uncharacterized SAM-binding protein YcdF (DUF218 family)
MILICSFEQEAGMKFLRKSDSDFWERNNPSREKRKWRSIRKKISYFVLVSILFILVFHQPILISYGKWLSPVSDNLDVDIVVPQGAGTNNDRLDTAIQIYKTGKAKSLMTVAISEKVFQENIKKYDLSSNSIYRGKCSDRTSFDNAISTKEGIKKFGLNSKSILVVTDKYVTRRIRMLFQHVLGSSVDVRVYPAQTSVQSTSESLSNPLWWHDDISRKWVVSETQKNIFYWFYYGILGRTDSVDVPFEDLVGWLTNSKIRMDSEQYSKSIDEWTAKVCGGANE